MSFVVVPNTLNPGDYLSYEELERDFIAAFSKTGLKHDLLSQIHGFNQKVDESVRDGANRLRQYLARCLEEKMPSQERFESRITCVLVHETP